MLIFLPLHRMVLGVRSSSSASGNSMSNCFPRYDAFATSSSMEAPTCKGESCFLHVYERAVYFGFSSRLTTRIDQDITSPGPPGCILGRRMYEGPGKGEYWKSSL